MGDVAAAVGTHDWSDRPGVIREPGDRAFGKSDRRVRAFVVEVLDRGVTRSVRQVQTPRFLEAATGIEPVSRVLQTLA